MKKKDTISHLDLGTLVFAYLEERCVCPVKEMQH